MSVCSYTRSYLVSSTSGMTDLERDEIDSAAQDFIHSCSKKIEALHQKGIHTLYTCVCMYMYAY